jgi:ribosome-binding factor A
MPFLRRQIGSRLRLKRVPELQFLYDQAIAGQDRIEQLLNEIKAEPLAARTNGDDDTSS